MFQWLTPENISLRTCFIIHCEPVLALFLVCWGKHAKKWIEFGWQWSMLCSIRHFSPSSPGSTRQVFQRHTCNMQFPLLSRSVSSCLRAFSEDCVFPLLGPAWFINSGEKLRLYLIGWLTFGLNFENCFSVVLINQMDKNKWMCLGFNFYPFVPCSLNFETIEPEDYCYWKITFLNPVYMWFQWRNIRNHTIVSILRVWSCFTKACISYVSNLVTAT